MNLTAQFLAASRGRQCRFPTEPFLTRALRRLVDQTRAIGVVLSLTIALVGPWGHASAMVVAPPLYPFEQAFGKAAIVVHGDIVAYDQQLGATLRVREVVRGDARAGDEYLLGGSPGYAFLASLPGQVTAFIRVREGAVLQLWQGPTSGGLIWSEPGLLERIMRAHANPKTALRASDPRERLAAAYFVVTNGAEKPSAAELDAIMDSAAWGLSHGSPSTHQAAVDILAALGYSLKALGITYHPLFKPEFKHAAETQLRSWWKQRH